jgi:hypothetical protein
MPLPSLRSWGTFWIVPNLAILAFVALGNQQTGEDASVPQEALKALMRGRLPAIESVPGVRINAWRLDPHEKLPAAIAVTELRDSPCRSKFGAMLGERHEQLVRNGRTAGRASDVARFPAQNLFEEGPGMSERIFSELI